ncbi:heme-binding protein [Mesorhizobium sp. DCY119]|uniref:GlcG/HbpS family heme-binding protein n=1 Tax=Mesorhizobium sp. DCY119 TaxID=2108445 RepID=UPI000E74E035|nr:heme-binding protein [Mesorhizobium sp. DCY119]RJG41399.1 heme-binding protein [Mesorhizobium sp. DCY119]
MLTTKTALTIGAAKAIACACETEAKARGLRVVIAIVDDGGHLMLLHRDDGSQVGSIEIATLKARTSVLFRRDTKAFQDVVEGQGRFALLCIPNGIPLDGGVLLKSGEEIIGAIGVSGASDEEDGDIGRIGAATV